MASPDAALHIGPQFVILETAAADAAADAAGTDQLQGTSCHVMFLARGKVGPFRVETEPIARPGRCRRRQGRDVRRGQPGQGDHRRLVRVLENPVTAPVLLLDGASMWFRSFFGVPSSITAPDGRPVNALRGFLDTVATLITRERPSRLVVCLDEDWRPQWRVDLIPSYKAHRVEQERPAGETDVEEVPDDLTPQVDMIMAMLDAFGIATAGASGYEADDVLGTLAARERRDPVVVVSGDRDLLQLVGDDPVAVRVFYMGRGLARATTFGPAEVAEQYNVPLERAGAAYAELALLRGDPSDGLPGVPGVGEKTAAALLAQFGSLEAIVAAAADSSSKMPGAQRKKLARRHRLHCGRRARGPGGHRRAGHDVTGLRRAAAGRSPSAEGRRTRGRTRCHVVDLSTADGARRAAGLIAYLGRPTS